MLKGVVCTVSPKTVPYLAELKKNGMKIVRLNGSFGIPGLKPLKALKLPILLDIPGNRKKKKTNNMSDEQLLKFAIENELDYVGVSYPDSSRDILKVRKKLEGTSVKIVGKIETEKAVRNALCIAEVSDMVLIDRGDLGTAIGFEKVPYYQGNIIDAVAWASRKVPVIIATEMMMSTINSKKPNCADVADVYNAVMQGADYVMLSEETAVFDDPVAPLLNMMKVVKYAKNRGIHLWGI